MLIETSCGMARIRPPRAEAYTGAAHGLMGLRDRTTRSGASAGTPGSGVAGRSGNEYASTALGGRAAEALTQGSPVIGAFEESRLSLDWGASRQALREFSPERAAVPGDDLPG